MTGAYDKQYLDKAMKNLGEAFDYAANSCEMDMDDFFNMFVEGGIAEQYAKGNPKVIVKKSGIELVIDVLTRMRLPFKIAYTDPQYYLSAQYWCGKILAYCQWRTGLSYGEICKYISMEELLMLYPALHDEDDEKAIEVLRKVIARTRAPSRLKAIRQASSLSQKALAEKVGISVYMLTQYEHRKRNLRKAPEEMVGALAKGLNCAPGDLLELVTEFI